MESDQWKEWREKWRCVLLSTPCAFSEIARSEFWKHAFNKRQSCLQDHESLTRTAMQSSMEIAAMKTIAEAQLGKKLSTPALSAELLRLGLAACSVREEGPRPGGRRCKCWQSEREFHFSRIECTQVYVVKSNLHRIADGSGESMGDKITFSQNDKFERIGNKARVCEEQAVGHAKPARLAL